MASFINIGHCILFYFDLHVEELGCCYFPYIEINYGRKQWNSKNYKKQNIDYKSVFLTPHDVV